MIKFIIKIAFKNYPISYIMLFTELKSSITEQLREVLYNGNLTCLDCGCQSATFRYNNDEDKLEAAKKTAELWNTGKVIYTGYGD